MGKLCALAALAAVVPGLGFVARPGPAPLAPALSARTEAEALRDEVAILELRAAVGRLRLEVDRAAAEVKVLQSEADQRRADEDRARLAAAEAKRRQRRPPSAATYSEAKRALLRTQISTGSLSGAPRLQVVLLNDNMNKRERVISLLTETANLTKTRAEAVTMKAHRTGAATVASFGRDEAQIEELVQVYSKLSDARLDVRVEAAPAAAAEDDSDDKPPPGSQESDGWGTGGMFDVFNRRK